MVSMENVQGYTFSHQIEVWRKTGVDLDSIPIQDPAASLRLLWKVGKPSQIDCSLSGWRLFALGKFKSN